jgi:uncharacterized protein
LLNHRQKIVLAALSVLPEAKFAPVQVQKIFFLIDQNVAEEIGGRQFNFAAYDYGPFDKTVYDELAVLQTQGYVKIENGDTVRKFSLTQLGLTEGGKTLSVLPKRSGDYLRAIVPWAHRLSFSQLVGAIYKEYPNMRENSIFRG